MSYQIYDSGGYVGDLCSNNGLNELKSAIGGKKPFSDLWDGGSIDITDNFLGAVSELPDSDKGVKNFKSLVKKCEDVVIITDGIFDVGEKSKGLTPDQKRLHWEAYAKKTDRQEEIFRRVFERVFNDQKNQVITELVEPEGQKPTGLPVEIYSSS